MLTVFYFTSEQVFECSLPTFYLVLGLFFYLNTSALRDVTGALAFHYFTNTKRVANIFSCLTLVTESVMVVPEVVVFGESLIYMEPEYTCKDHVYTKRWSDFC